MRALADVILIPPGEDALARCIQSFTATGCMTFVAETSRRRHMWQHQSFPRPSSREHPWMEEQYYEPSHRQSTPFDQYMHGPAPDDYAHNWRSYPLRRNLWVDTRSNSTPSASHAYSSSAGTTARTHSLAATRTRSSELASVSVSPGCACVLHTFSVCETLDACELDEKDWQHFP
jgi:hypothetical protein